MSDPMDQRFAERRRHVAEQGARRRLRWVLVLTVVTALACLGFWAIRSPLLEVKHLVVEGSDRSDPAALLHAAGVAPGMAMVSVDEERARDALVAEPWIAEAEVRTVWPNSVEVTVLEYLPIAWVGAPDGWFLVSQEGAIVVAAAEPTANHPRIELRAESTPLGERLVDKSILGAVRFVASLDPGVRASIRVEERAGELWATGDGFEARLGRPIEMAEKAAALQALLEKDLPDGSRFDLIAPTRPAVAPGVPVEAEGGALEEALP